MFLLGKKQALSSGIALVAEGPATGLLQFAAHNAFYKLPLAQIVKVMRAEGMVPDKHPSLYKSLKELVAHCLPDLPPGTLAAILSQRCQVQAGTTAEGLDARAVKDF
eukprot:8189386-Lingulodinium_polyedra.AAC.1